MNQTQNFDIIFGTGPVGRAVMSELLARGRHVRIVNRSGKAAVPENVEVMAGDAADPDLTRRLCQGAEVVYDCVNAPYTQWPEIFPRLQAGILAGAAAAGAKLVVMENLYMYGPTGGRPLTEDLPYAAQTRKGRVRASMANALLEAHHRGLVRVAIGRASDFFGPWVLDSSAGERMFVPALQGRSIQLMGDLDLPHTYTYIGDIGKALVILGERDEALGCAWHLPSPQTVTTREFVRMVCAEAGTVPRLRTAPRWVMNTLGFFNPQMREVAEMIYEFEEPFVLDHSRFANVFGDHATPLPQAIRRTVKWFQERTTAAK